MTVSCNQIKLVSMAAMTKSPGTACTCWNSKPQHADLASNSSSAVQPELRIGCTLTQLLVQTIAFGLKPTGAKSGQNFRLATPELEHFSTHATINCVSEHMRWSHASDRPDIPFRNCSGMTVARDACGYQCTLCNLVPANHSNADVPATPSQHKLAKMANRVGVERI